MCTEAKPSSKYIYDLPYRHREKLCRILDIHDKWKSLGGYMKFSTLEIQQLERLEKSGKSPSDELLTRWSQQNHTVQELYFLLYRIKHFQAMTIIKMFVDEKYHYLLYEGEERITRLLNEEACAGAAGPIASSISQNFYSNAKSGVSMDTVKAFDEKNLTFGMHNLNVQLPDGSKHNKMVFKDAQGKIQNLRPSISVEENTGNEAAALPLTPPVLPEDGGTKLNLRLSPTGRGALAGQAAGNTSNLPSPGTSPTNLQQINIPPTAPSYRKLSDASMSSSPSEWSVLPQPEYKAMEEATNGWDRRKILGRGGFGTVFRGTWKNTQVAIKRLEMPKGESQVSQEVQRQQSHRELNILQSIRHDNILQLYGFSIGGDQPCLVYQYMENGSLEDRLLCRNGTKPLTWPQRHNIAKGTARGLQYLHTIQEKPLIHGDIKSANILLDSNFEPRIGDFGLAREGPHTQCTHLKVSRVHGTRPYLPDEFLRSKKLSTKVDTFSFGVVLFELATGLRAYDESRQNKFLKEEVLNCPEDQLIMLLMDKKDGLGYPHIFMDFINLGKTCIAKYTKDRPEMVDVWKKLDSNTNKQAFDSPQVLPSPMELQVFYDRQSQHRRLSLNQTPNTGMSAASSHPTNVQPSNGVQVSSTPANNSPLSARPVSSSQGGSVPNSGLSFPLAMPRERSPTQKNTDNVASPSTPSTPPVDPLALLQPKPSPVISVLPATGSVVDTSVSISSSSESSSMYSRTSFKDDIDDLNSEEASPGDLPLLSVLGVIGPSSPFNSSERQETSEGAVSHRS